MVQNVFTSHPLVVLYVYGAFEVASTIYKCMGVSLCVRVCVCMKILGTKMFALLYVL